MKNHNNRNMLFMLAGTGVRSSVTLQECQMIQAYLTGKKI